MPRPTVAQTLPPPSPVVTMSLAPIDQAEPVAGPGWDDPLDSCPASEEGSVTARPPSLLMAAAWPAGGKSRPARHRYHAQDATTGSRPGSRTRSPTVAPGNLPDDFSLLR